MTSQNKKKRLFLLENIKWTSKCFYCASEKDLTLEHKVPRCRGGSVTNTYNLEVSCLNCNNDKGPLTHDEYLYLRSKPEGHLKVQHFKRWLNKQIDPLSGIKRSAAEQTLLKELGLTKSVVFSKTFTLEELDLLSTSKNALKRQAKRISEELANGQK